jgi:TonB family protein
LKTRPLHLCAFILLLLEPLFAQQAASVIDQSTSTKESNSSSRLTANGVVSCPEEFKSQTLPEGVFRVGGNVLPPIATSIPGETITYEARTYANDVMKKQHIKSFEVKSLVSLTVDPNGLPQDICVLNEIGHGFDLSAVDAVQQYRFKPATLNGKPVSVRLKVEVAFALW